MAKKTTHTRSIGIIPSSQILNHPTRSLRAKDHLRPTSFMARSSLSKARLTVEKAEEAFNTYGSLSRAQRDQARRMLNFVKSGLERAELLSASYCVRAPQSILTDLLAQTTECVRLADELITFMNKPGD